LLLLTIGKLPEFDSEGNVVVGQCEPYSSGWLLRLREKGLVEKLLEGTYYDLRQIQLQCFGLDSGKIRELVDEARPKIEAGRASLAVSARASNSNISDETDTDIDMNETAVIDNASLGRDVEKTDMPVGPVAPGEAGLVLRRQGDCLVVRFEHSQEITGDLIRLRGALFSVMEHGSGPCILDLCEMGEVSSRIIAELVLVREEAAGQGRPFAIVTDSPKIIASFEALDLIGFLPLFDNARDAVKALAN
jgi:hypothetical protein